MKDVIKELKQEVNQKLGFEIRRQSDVRYLHQSIVLENNFSIGFNTLRRFFGFLPQRAPQLQTLGSAFAIFGLQVLLGFFKLSSTKIKTGFTGLS